MNGSIITLCKLYNYQLTFLGRGHESNQELIREVSSPAPVTSTTEQTVPTTTTTTTTMRPVMRVMTKERRGMMEEPIFRPENAKDPQFIYRGRKKRSAPIVPFMKENDIKA